MNTTEQHSSKNQNTAAVQQWVDGQCQKEGLVDIKFFVRHSDESTAESFSAEVLQMLQARVVPGVALE